MKIMRWDNEVRIMGQDNWMEDYGLWAMGEGPMTIDVVFVKDEISNESVFKTY